jgi:hypothetical protein
MYEVSKVFIATESIAKCIGMESTACPAGTEEVAKRPQPTSGRCSNSTNGDTTTPEDIAHSAVGRILAGMLESLSIW